MPNFSHTPNIFTANIYLDSGAIVNDRTGEALTFFDLSKTASKLGIRYRGLVSAYRRGSPFLGIYYVNYLKVPHCTDLNSAIGFKKAYKYKN